MKTMEIEKTFNMDQVFVTKVIISTKARRGNGKDTPIRVITEIFSLKGEKIAEYDPGQCEYCGSVNCTSDHK